MICETLVQTFVLTAQPKASAPTRPGSEARTSDSPITRARTSSLILGAVVALLRTAVERLWFTLMNRAWRNNYKNRTPKGSHFSPLTFAALKSIARFLALFVRSQDMPESTDILLARPTVVPPLDPEFRPVALGNCRYRQAVAAGKTKVPLAIALERNEGHVSVFKTEIWPAGSGHDAATRLYVERLVKFLLWQIGGWKILICGPREIGEFIAPT